MFEIIYYNLILKKNESMSIRANDKMDARLKFLSMWSLPLKIIDIRRQYHVNNK